MGHPEIVNRTPYAFEPLFIADEEQRPVLVVLIKATYEFDLDGELTLAPQQAPIDFTGERWTKQPDSSYKYEPETALCKLATDVVLVGHAWPTASGITQMDVGIKVGPVRKLARVFGDREWVFSRHGVVLTATAALDRIPLTWERAFGGSDLSGPLNGRPALEARNPLGVGFGMPLAKDGDRLRLPNIEDPDHPLERYGDVVPPCGFGFTSPGWQPRASMAGTYDAHWEGTRKPMLPADFDRRFFNAAAPGLVAPGYLEGGEDVVILNASPQPRLAFRLPAGPPPQCRVFDRNGAETELLPRLDTLIVNTDDQRLFMLWRGHTLIGAGPPDVSAITVGAEGL